MAFFGLFGKRKSSKDEEINNLLSELVSKLEREAKHIKSTNEYLEKENKRLEELVDKSQKNYNELQEKYDALREKYEALLEKRINTVKINDSNKINTLDKDTRDSMQVLLESTESGEEKVPKKRRRRHRGGRKHRKKKPIDVIL